MINKYKFYLLFILIDLFAISSSFGQLSINFPVSRIVFQRNNSNQSTFMIYGTYTQTADQVEARVVPVVTGQGTATAWTLIQSNPSNGIFKGTLQATGGWYNLEVRTKLAGNVVETSSVAKIGIGEVFIISGQSNAQGSGDYTGARIGSNDDRVSCINWAIMFMDEKYMPFEFSQLAYNYRIAPSHGVPFFWSRLGDLLVSQLNVPVLFYGAAIGGTSSFVWSESAAGNDLRNTQPFFVKTPGQTYRNIKATIQQYATRTGTRGVFWMQGESDVTTDNNVYFNNINLMIQQSRKDMRKSNLAWVIARTGTQPGGNQPRDGQNRLGTELSNVFLGPITDDLQGTENRENGHFAGQGLVNVANMWKDQLNAINFYSNSTPVLPEIIQNNTCLSMPSMLQPATTIYALPASKLLKFQFSPVFQINASLSGYNYSYIITRQSDDIILNITSNQPDLTNSTTYPEGQYTIRGIHSLATTNLTTYIGNSHANLQNQIANGTLCASLSSNFVSVFVKNNLCPNINYTISGYSQGSTWVPVFTETNQRIYSTEKIITQSRVFYDSDKAIILQPGFRVDAGAIFIAAPDGCGGIENFYKF